jgi:hypothetical protein
MEEETHPIRRLRANLNLTIYEMQARVGIPVERLHELESGTPPIPTNAEIVAFIEKAGGPADLAAKCQRWMRLYRRGSLRVVPPPGG